MPKSKLPEISLFGQEQAKAHNGSTKALIKLVDLRIPAQPRSASREIWSHFSRFPLLVASRAVPLLGMTVDPDRAYWDAFFRCSSKGGWISRFTPAHTFTALAAVSLVAGTVASITAAARGPSSVGGPSWVGPRFNYYCLLGSTVGSCLVYVYLQFSKVLVIIGFAYCGYYYFMWAYVAIIVCAQLFAAKEYATVATTIRGRMHRFLISLLQRRVFLDARESLEKGKITASFARQKFIDAVGDSGPQAVFTIYVMYCLQLRFNLALSLSVFSSVVGMACGFAVWLEFTLQQQLADDEVPEEEFCLHWYHYCIWVSYFGSDFALRLLTLGLFLAQDALYPYSFAAFALLLVAYFLAAAIPIYAHYTDERRKEQWSIKNEGVVEVYEVTRGVMAYRATDALLFTFLVHALPADLRLAPRTRRESELFSVLDPEVRARIQRFVVPLRAADFLMLGGVAMYVDFEGWQCMALVSLFMSSQLLLLQVWLLKRPETRDPVEALSMRHVFTKQASDTSQDVAKAASADALT